MHHVKVGVEKFVCDILRRDSKWLHREINRELFTIQEIIDGADRVWKEIVLSFWT